MELRKSLFIFGGGGMILYVIAFRILKNSRGQDGMKLLLFLGPPAAMLLAAVLIWLLVKMLTRKPKTANLSAGLFFLLSAIACLGINIFQPEFLPELIGKYRKQNTVETQPPAPPPKPSKPSKPPEPAPNAKAEETAPYPPPAPAPPAEKAPAAQPPKTVQQEDLGKGDPFHYSTAGSDDYQPTQNNKFVSAISIKGIIRLADSEPLAILQLRDTQESFYVRKGNVIRVNQPKKGSSMNEIYLQIKSIRDDEVEIIQQERPDRVIIVR